MFKFQHSKPRIKTQETSLNSTKLHILLRMADIYFEYLPLLTLSLFSYS